MRPPKFISPDVVAFCRSVVAKPQPVYVPLYPLPGAAESSCFDILPKHVAQHGGEQVIGWSIWQWPRVFIEAEFHTVWRQPDGDLLDITPKKYRMPRILFLPDSTRHYEGRQVDNIRQPTADPDAMRLCEIFTLIHHEFNKGELADYHGEVAITPALERLTKERDQLGLRLSFRYGIYLPEPFIA